MSIGFGTGMGLRFGEIKEYDKDTLAKYNRIIDLMRHNTYLDGLRELQSLCEYLEQQGVKGQFSYYDMVVAYAQLMYEADEERKWILSCANQVIPAEKKTEFQARVKLVCSQSCVDTAQSSKTDILHDQMKRGEWKPALREDIPTERLQHLRDEGLSYDRIADAVGMSKSGVAARLKGYKPQKANK